MATDLGNINITIHGKDAPVQPALMAVGSSRLAAITAVSTAVVAALEALKIGIGLAVKALEVWRDKATSTAKFIGNMDPRIAVANAMETIAQVNRRILASREVGGYAALSVQRETALADAIASLERSFEPIKSAIFGGLMYAATSIVNLVEQLVRWVTSVANSLGIMQAIESRLATIQKNTAKSPNMATANWWAIGEARSFGAKNW